MNNVMDRDRGGSPGVVALPFNKKGRGTALSASTASAARSAPLNGELQKNLEEAKRSMNKLVLSTQSNPQAQQLRESWLRSKSRLREQQQEWEQQLKQQHQRLQSQVEQATVRLNRLSQTAAHLSAGEAGYGMRKSQSAMDFSSWRDTMRQDRGSTTSLTTRKIVSDDAVKNLEAAAKDLLAGPRKTLASCQATLENCQDNLQVLSELMAHTALPVLPMLKASVDIKAPLGSDSASFKSCPRMAALDSPTSASTGSPSHTDLSNMEVQLSDKEPATRSFLSPSAILPAHMRDREIQAIEGLLADADRLEQSLESDRPEKQQAPKRKRSKKGGETSSLREPGRNVAIVTTAALPWMTGTAVNPLLRAAYLSREGEQPKGELAENPARTNPQVTLMIPWLGKHDQRAVFPDGKTFDTPEQQEAYVREWAQKRTGFKSNFRVTFYPGRYAAEKGSILPVGDPTKYIADHEADVAVLEEPEHLNWYHHGRRWTDKFDHVVGIIHTNYLDYARREEGGDLKEKFLKALNSWVCRVHCHKVVKLSDAVQQLPRQTTEFVHGVPHQFLDVGEKKAQQPDSKESRFGRGAYFMGKAVWAKGYTELLALMEKRRAAGKEDITLDCYGNGEDLEAVKAEAKRRALNMKFHGAKDHLDQSMHEYKVFINPSMSDVVATTTAEALAMGKWVLVHDHPSNRFFGTFDNCLTYKDPEEFTVKLEHALSHDPQPMTPEQRKRLTWEDATERFLDIAELKADERPGVLEAAVDKLAWAAHNTLTGLEPLRQAAGAGGNTLHAPEDLASWEPVVDKGGVFDRRAAHAALAEAAQMDRAAASAPIPMAAVQPLTHQRSRSL